LWKCLLQKRTRRSRTPLVRYNVGCQFWTEDFDSLHDRRLSGEQNSSRSGSYWKSCIGNVCQKWALDHITVDYHRKTQILSAQKYTFINVVLSNMLEIHRPTWPSHKVTLSHKTTHNMTCLVKNKFSICEARTAILSFCRLIRFDLSECLEYKQSSGPLPSLFGCQQNFLFGSNADVCSCWICSVLSPKEFIQEWITYQHAHLWTGITQ